MRRGVEAILLDGSVLLRKYDPPPTNWQSAAAARNRHSPHIDAPREVIPVVFVGGLKHPYRYVRRQAHIFFSIELHTTTTERCPSPRPGPPRAPRRRRVARPSAKTGVYLRREIALECGLRACPAAGQRPRNPSPRKPCCRVRSLILAKEWPDSSASAAELRPGTEARSLATRRSRESSRSRPVRSVPDLDHG